MGNRGYKKYMKQEVREENPLIKIFIISFFAMLLIMTMLIKSFAPTVDTSVGGEMNEVSSFQDDDKNAVDGSLEAIQNEDRGRDFADIMSKAEDVPQETKKTLSQSEPKEVTPAPVSAPVPEVKPVAQDVVYKVYIGTYSSAEQAKVAKDIIQESGSGFSPIVKCIGSNNYTLQVGIFKNKQSAEAMLYSVQQNHLPGRIVQEN